MAHDYSKPKINQTHDNRLQQETLIVDDRKTMYRNLFEAWKQSKNQDGGYMDGYNKDSFFLQNADCK